MPVLWKSSKQENDSLRLALKIIVQEKNECDSRPQKADDRWSLVENSHAANRMKIKRNQQTIPSDNTDTCNRFEPLGDGVQGNVSLTPNNEAKGGGRNGISNTRRSQTSNSRNRTDRAMRTSDSGMNDPTNQLAKRKEMFIAGDSILKNLQGRKISRSAKVKVSSFPGCTTMDMSDHIKPILRTNPDAIVMHGGTNSLRSSASVRDCAEEIVNLPPWLVMNLRPILRYPVLFQGLMIKSSPLKYRVSTRYLKLFAIKMDGGMSTIRISLWPKQEWSTPEH